MDLDPRLDWDELERQWDVSQDAADGALDEWFEGDTAGDGKLIDKVLSSQRRQKEALDAVRASGNPVSEDQVRPVSGKRN